MLASCLEVLTSVTGETEHFRWTSETVSPSVMRLLYGGDESYWTAVLWNIVHCVAIFRWLVSIILTFQSTKYLKRTEPIAQGLYVLNGCRTMHSNCHGPLWTRYAYHNTAGVAVQHLHKQTIMGEYFIFLNVIRWLVNKWTGRNVEGRDDDYNLRHLNICRAKLRKPTISVRLAGTGADIRTKDLTSWKQGCCVLLWGTGDGNRSRNLIMS
jgi:hypothetical protein